MKPLLLMLVLLTASLLPTGLAQTKPVQVQEIKELKKPRADFIKATIEYKASLQKLSAVYENKVRMAEEKIELSQKLHAQGLISMSQVDESKRTLAVEKDNLEQTKHKIESADRQIAESSPIVFLDQVFLRGQLNVSILKRV